MAPPGPTGDPYGPLRPRRPVVDCPMTGGGKRLFRKLSVRIIKKDDPKKNYRNTLILRPYFPKPPGGTLSSSCLVSPSFSGRRGTALGPWRRPAVRSDVSGKHSRPLRRSEPVLLSQNTAPYPTPAVAPRAGSRTSTTYSPLNNEATGGRKPMEGSGVVATVSSLPAVLPLLRPPSSGSPVGFWSTPLVSTLTRSIVRPP